MSVEQTFIVTLPEPDAITVSPQGHTCFRMDNRAGCDPAGTLLTVAACGFTYKLCGRCGSITIKEKPYHG